MILRLLGQSALPPSSSRLAHSETVSCGLRPETKQTPAELKLIQLSPNHH